MIYPYPYIRRDAKFCVSLYQAQNLASLCIRRKILRLSVSFAYLCQTKNLASLCINLYQAQNLASLYQKGPILGCAMASVCQVKASNKTEESNRPSPSSKIISRSVISSPGLTGAVVSIGREAPPSLKLRS
jgi:hypothetical protein